MPLILQLKANSDIKIMQAMSTAISNHPTDMVPQQRRVEEEILMPEPSKIKTSPKQGWPPDAHSLLMFQQW